MSTILLNPQGLEQLKTSEPEWIQRLRAEAFTSYETQQYPSGRDEQWRRTDPERVRAGEQAVVSPTTSLDGERGQGVTFDTLESALVKHTAWAETHFYQLAPAGKSPHLALNGAFWKGGTYLHLSKDASTGEGYLKAHHRFQGGGAALPRTLIQMQAHSRATLVEIFEADDQPLLAAPVVEINVADGAHLTYVFVNRWGPSSNVVPQFMARVGRDANLTILFMGTGSSLTKCFAEADLVGTGARSELLGMVMGTGRQHYDIDTQQNHRVGATVSDVLCHVALTDRARSVFAGNILCEPGAQKIDGYQQNRNLLLSDKARADSMPRLEIEANDVRCTHGASFSTYDQAQQFYLQSRGLTASEAEHLLVTGFFAEVCERIHCPPLVEWLEQEIQGVLQSALDKA